VAQRALGAEGRSAQGGFMDQVEGQTRGQAFLGQLARPSPQQVPSAQAEVFGHQQPQAQQVARDFIGQELADASLDAAGVGGLAADAFGGALGGDGGRRFLGVEGVEFFFVSRNRR
jgi:hypothetical protein